MKSLENCIFDCLNRNQFISFVECNLQKLLFNSKFQIKIFSIQCHDHNSISIQKKLKIMWTSKYIVI